MRDRERDREMRFFKSLESARAHEPLLDVVGCSHTGFIAQIAHKHGLLWAGGARMAEWKNLFFFYICIGA